MTASFTVATAGYFYTEDLTNPNLANWTSSNSSFGAASTSSIGLTGQSTMMYNQPVGPGGSEVKITVRLKDQTKFDYFETLFGSPFGLGAYKILVGVQNPYEAATSYVAAFLTTGNGTVKLAQSRANIHDGSVVRAILNANTIGVYLDDSLLFAVPTLSTWPGGQLGIGATTAGGDGNAIAAVSLGDGAGAFLSGAAVPGTTSDLHAEDLRNPDWSNWTASTLAVQRSADGAIGIGGQGNMMFTQPVAPGSSEVRMSLRVTDPSQSDTFGALFGADYAPGSYLAMVGVHDPYETGAGYAAAFVSTSKGLERLGYFSANIHDGSVARTVLTATTLSMYLDDQLLFAVPTVSNWAGGQLGIGASSGQANAIASVTLGGTAQLLSEVRERRR